MIYPFHTDIVQWILFYCMMLTDMVGRGSLLSEVWHNHSQEML